MKWTALLLTCVTYAEAARILALFNYRGPSHYRVFHTYLRELAARGHQVEVVGHYPLSPPAPNYTDLVLEVAGGAAVGAVTVDSLASVGLFHMLYFFKRDMLDSCRAMLAHPHVTRLLASESSYDLVVTHLAGPDCLIGFSHRFKAPLISVDTSMGFPWTGRRLGNPDHPANAPINLLPHTDHMDFWERVVNTLYYWSLNLWYHVEMERSTQAMMRDAFGPACPSLGELQRSTSLVLVNRHFSLSGPRPSVPALVEVGGLHIGDDKEQLPHDLQTFLDEAVEGAIYFSLGSMIRSESFTESKLRAFTEAFSQLPQRVLWKNGNNVLGLPANVRTADWFPQQVVLNHPNVVVFITHGGNLGVQEAVHAGVPMLGMPLMLDQPHNVKQCVARGAALQLDYHDVTTHSLLQALHRLIHDPSYRKNAKRLSQLFRDRPESPLDTAIYWTEYVIRHRGAPHLQSAAVNLPWYQYLLLDVVLFIIALIISMGFIIFYSFKIMLKLVTANLSR